MTKDFDLFKELDTFITRPRIDLGRDNSHFYPSEASVKYFDRHGDLTTEGGCLRATYHRITNGVKRLPNEARSEWIFRLGKNVELILVEEMKRLGIFVDHNVRLYNKEYNISGEVDVIAREPNGATVCYEVKSFDGYYAEKELFGNRSQKGFPKLGQLLQLLIYLNECRDVFDYGRMVYFSRGNARRKTFKVELIDEGDVTYPVVDEEVIKSFTIQDMYDRYVQLKGFIERKELPPKDYELEYPEDKVRDFYRKGKVAKTTFEKWEKGRLKKDEYAGDWQCRYCGFKNVCYGVDKAFGG